MRAVYEAGPGCRQRTRRRAEVRRRAPRYRRSPPATGERVRFAARDWPAFPDSAQALAALQRRYRLAIVSNVDDDLFAASARRLGVAFDWIVTAEQVRSYKPAPAHFLRAIERIGLPRDSLLHVAQSLYHDVAPARSLGLSTVWVNRRLGKAGSGATPAAQAEPDFTVPDLRALASAMGLT